MTQTKKKRRKKSYAVQKIALRVRQISVMAGGFIILFVLTLWMTGMLKPISADNYEGRNASMNPSLVDPALNKATPSLANDEGNSKTNNPFVVVEISKDSSLDNNENNNENNNEPQASEEPTTQEPESLTLQTTEPQESINVEDELSVVDDEEIPAAPDYLQMKIEAHRDEIDDEDLNDFLRIIQYLDQGYIGDLAIDGFEPEEQAALKEHLHSRLSDADYNRSKELFTMYDYLLYEE